jgi:hypothetical protein
LDVQSVARSGPESIAHGLPWVVPPSRIGPEGAAEDRLRTFEPHGARISSPFCRRGVSTLGTNTPERRALTRRYAVCALGKNTRSARVGGVEGAPDRIY